MSILPENYTPDSLLSMKGISYKRLKKISLIFIGLWFSYSIVVYFIIPAVLKSQIIKQTSNFIHATVKIESIKINPYTFQAEISNLAISPNSTFESSFDSVLKLDRASLNLDIIPLIFQRTLRIKNISIVKPEIFIERYKDNTINWLNLIKASDETSFNEKSSELPNIKISLLRFAVQDLGINILDNEYDALATLAIENYLAMDEVNFSINDNEFMYGVNHVQLKNYQLNLALQKSPDTSAIKMALDSLEIMNINNRGEDLTISLTSQLNEAPMGIQGFANIKQSKTRGHFQLSNLDTSIINQYLQLFMPYAIQGEVSLDNTWDLDWSTLELDFTNKTEINDISLIYNPDEIDLFTVKQFAIQDLSLKLPENELVIESIKVNNPKTSLTINADSKIHELEIVTKSIPSDGNGDRPQVSTQSQTENTPFSANIKQVDISKGLFSIIDKVEDNKFSLQLDNINIQNASSQSDAIANISGNGRINNAGEWTISVQSKIQDWDSSSKLDFKINSFNMTELADYSKKFIGYKLENGILNMSVDYQLADGKMIGANELNIKSFKIGPKENPKPVINAPIPLAVSLLRDLSGNINLSVPVSGNINDPSFKLSNVISSALANVILKLVSAPFSIIGKLAGVSQDSADLSVIVFPTASAEINEALKKKIELLKKGISQRPSLAISPKIFISPNDRNSLHLSHIDKIVLENFKTENPTVTNIEDSKKLELYKSTLANFTGYKNLETDAVNSNDLAYNRTLIEKWIKKIFTPKSKSKKTDENNPSSTSLKTLSMKNIQTALKEYIPLPDSQLLELYNNRRTSLENVLKSMPHAIKADQLITPSIPEKITDDILSKASKVEFELIPNIQ